MEYHVGKSSKVVVMRIDDGEEIISSLKTAIVECNIKVGYVETLVGGARDIDYSHFTKKSDGSIGSKYSTLLGPCNILAAGVFMPDKESGEILFHIHFSAGIFGKEARACHLNRAIAHFYCDVVLVEIEDVEAVKSQFSGLPDVEHAKITEFL